MHFIINGVGYFYGLNVPPPPPPSSSSSAAAPSKTPEKTLVKGNKNNRLLALPYDTLEKIFFKFQPMGQCPATNLVHVSLICRDLKVMFYTDLYFAPIAKALSLQPSPTSIKAVQKYYISQLSSIILKPAQVINFKNVKAAIIGKRPFTAKQAMNAQRAFHQAVVENKNLLIPMFFEAGINPHPNTLMEAASNGNFKVVWTAIKRDLALPDGILTQGILSNDFGLARLLLQHGATHDFETWTATYTSPHFWLIGPLLLARGIRPTASQIFIFERTRTGNPEQDAEFAKRLEYMRPFAPPPNMGQLGLILG